MMLNNSGRYAHPLVSENTKIIRKFLMSLRESGFVPVQGANEPESHCTAMDLLR